MNAKRPAVCRAFVLCAAIILIAMVGGGCIVLFMIYDWGIDDFAGESSVLVQIYYSPASRNSPERLQYLQQIYVIFTIMAKYISLYEVATHPQSSFVVPFMNICNPAP